MTAPGTTAAGPRRALVYACFAASGTAGLVLEVVWSKYLSLLSGNSMQGVATVVAAFLGGLGIGAFLGGRISERSREPLVTYAKLEALVALFGIASPFAFEAGRPALAWLHAATGGGAAFAVLRFAVLFAALLPPTIAMGASLPLVASDFSRRGAAFGASVGRLYAWNTGGAVLGVVLAGFALIPLFGLSVSAYVASALDLAVAAAILVARPAAPPDAAPPAAEDADAAPQHPVLARLFVPMFAVSGFTSILYEVAWTRVLCVPLGGMVYSLAAILAVYLAGIALGAAAAARVLARTSRPVLLFAVCEVLVAATVVAGAHLFPWIPVRMASLVAGAADAPVRLVAGELAIVALVVLPASFLFGALFPLAAAIHRRGTASTGRAVGGLYAANTLGSIAGSIATGFALIPWLGCLGSILAAAAVNLAIGIVTLLVAEPPMRRRALLAGGVAAAALATGLVALPTWRTHRMTVGFTRLIREARDAGKGAGAEAVIAVVDEKSGAERVRFYEEGRVASVAVLESAGDRVLVVNGKPDASVGAASDMVTQVMIGQLPLLFAPSARRVAIVGYGSGVTTNAVLTHRVASVLTVEIEPAVVAAAPWFRGGAGEPLADPRSTLVIDDAGTYLRSTDELYDVIISEPSNPWLAGVGDLFTSEFYDEAASRVAPGGVFTQWVQCYEISPATQGVILRTLARRFPEGQVFFFRAASDMVIVTSPDRAVTIDPSALAAAFADDRIRGDMARVGVDAPAEVLRSYVGTLSRLARRAGDGPVNTDDNGWLEHHAPLDVVRGNWKPDFGLPSEIGADLADSLPEGSEEAVRLLADALDRAVADGDRGGAAVFAFALDRLGRAEAEDVKSRLGVLERNAARFQEAEMLSRESGPHFERAAQRRDPVAGERAVGLLGRAAELHPSNGRIAWHHGSALLMTGKLDAAIAEFRRALTLAPPTTTFTVRNDLAGALFMKGDFAGCLAQADAIDRLVPGGADAVMWRARVRHASGDTRGARELVAGALRDDPGNPRLLDMERMLAR